MKPLTALEFAGALGLSTRSVRDFVARGIVSRDADGHFPWPTAVQQYCGHIREIGAGRGTSSAMAVSSERARWLRARADRAETDNRIAAGTYVAASEVEKEWSTRFATIKRVLLAFPARLSWLDRSARSDLDHEIRGLLELIANGDHA